MSLLNGPHFEAEFRSAYVNVSARLPLFQAAFRAYSLRWGFPALTGFLNGDALGVFLDGRTWLIWWRSEFTRFRATFRAKVPRALRSGGAFLFTCVFVHCTLYGISCARYAECVSDEVIVGSYLLGYMYDAGTLFS